MATLKAILRTDSGSVNTLLHPLHRPNYQYPDEICIGRAQRRNYPENRAAGATGLTDMELALLDTSIGSNNYANERQNPPLDWKDNIDEDGDGRQALDTYSEVKYYNQTCIAPHGLLFFWAAVKESRIARAKRLRVGTNGRLHPQRMGDLIRATPNTVEHLILDPHPFAEEIEMDATGGPEFLALYPYGLGGI
ncbi:hypothetical protein B0H14DRAFT_3651107 [Mycena olivaceomarginata]|nr:hypothetical protein B0H14DRAFT_3651107 [Mycena olivaceomarginata]